MNRYMIVHRLRWPAMLLLTGVIALLDQADILSWGHAWPLYLILFGVFALAERALISVYPPPAPFPGAGYPAQGYPTPGYPTPGYPASGYQTPGYAPTSAAPVPPVPAAQSTSLVPVENDLSITRRDEEEGR
jgi:hypothetical protein